MKLKIAIKSGGGRSKSITAERLVNLYAEKAEIQAKSETVVHGTPGLDLFATCSDSPGRGLCVMDGILYAVSGDTLFSVSSTGTATAITGLVGGDGYVQMATNGTQLVICTNGLTYVYSIADGLTPITDPDFPEASSVTYMDGYFIFSVRGSGQWVISALYDGADYDALDFATAEAAPDDLLRVFVDHRELWLFGSETAEVWTNQGLSPFPFARYEGATTEKGLGAKNSVAKVDNSIYWLDNTGVVRRAEQGYTPVRISTHAIEYEISRGTLADAEASTYTQEGHEFYVLTVPGAGTYVYDAATQVWHERKSFGETRWRARDIVRCYDEWLCADFDSGKVFTLNLDSYDDNGDSIISEMIFPPIHNQGDRFTLHDVTLEMETGVANDSEVTMELSRDGLTWSNESWVSMGDLGQRTTGVTWNRLGQHRNAHLRFRISAAAKRAIYAAYATIEPDE